VISFSDRARVIAVASGKGGAGKTNVSVNLAVAFARLGGRTMLVDCDMGLANAAILLGMPSAWTIGDLLAGRCGIEDLLQRGPAGLQFLPGHSGTGSGSTLSAAERGRLMEALKPYAARFDHIVIDTGGGIDVAIELAADDYGVGLYAAGHVRARLNRQIALDVDVSLEVTGDADMARAVDLALDGQTCSNDGLFRRPVGAILRRGRTRGGLTHGGKDGHFLGRLRRRLRPALIAT